MALTIKKKIQNYTVDQGATFSKTIEAENSSSVAVDISAGTVSGSIIKNFSYSPTLKLEDGGEILLNSTDGSGGDVGDNITIEPQAFTTSLTGANCTFSLTATQTAELVEGKYYYSLNYTQSDNVTKERLAEGLITVEASA
jgi:molybdopterin-binding protein